MTIGSVDDAEAGYSCAAFLPICSGGAFASPLGAALLFVVRGTCASRGVSSNQCMWFLCL